MEMKLKDEINEQTKKELTERKNSTDFISQEDV